MSSMRFKSKPVIGVKRSGKKNSVFNFISDQVQYKKQLGKIRSSETYQSTLNSFMHFRNHIDLTFAMIDSDLIESYEAEMRNRGLSCNTTSFYMRILRTNYRLAVEKGLTSDCHPFRRVYCGIDKTVKRSISLKDIKRIKEADFSGMSHLDYARDMFVFSFCTRGMSFIDMAYLRKKDVNNGYLVYRRRKTGQMLTVEWTRQMQEVIEKYPSNPTQYLLPIIMREDGNERRQYQNQMTKINRALNPLSIISEGLGHDSEITTQIYLDSIKSHEVDKANREILKEL